MRKKFSGQEKQEILRRYKESGKTVAQFGRDNEISAINIQRWLKKEEAKLNNAAEESRVSAENKTVLPNLL